MIGMRSPTLEQSGAPRVDGTFTRLGVESLPGFFQELISVQEEKANTHLFAECYQEKDYP
jgi:hypothetical protein